MNKYLIAECVEFVGQDPDDSFTCRVYETTDTESAVDRFFTLYGVDSEGLCMALEDFTEWHQVRDLVVELVDAGRVVELINSEGVFHTLGGSQ